MSASQESTDAAHNGPHVHLWPTGSADDRRHLLFRDWLRVDGDDRSRYEEVKRGLAERDWPDLNDRAEAKGPTVADIMIRAEAWADATGWSRG